MSRGLLARLLILVAMGGVLFMAATGPRRTYSAVEPTNLNSGPWAPAVLDPIYARSGSDGIGRYIEDHPLPLSSIDVDTGREVIGWSVEGREATIAGEGVSTADPKDERRVPRAFGVIVLHYAPVR